MKAHKFFPEQIALCKSGDRLALWTKPGLEVINAYREKSIGGQGLAVQFLKSENPEIAAPLAKGLRSWIEIELLADGRMSVIAKADSEANVVAAETARRQALRVEILKPLHSGLHHKAKLRTRSRAIFERGYALFFLAYPLEEYLHEDCRLEFLIPPYGSSGFLHAPISVKTKILRAHFCGATIEAAVSGTPARSITTGNFVATWDEIEVDITVSVSPG